MSLFHQERLGIMARLNEVTEMIRDIFMIGSILEVLRNLMINCINIFYGVIENP